VILDTNGNIFRGFTSVEWGSDAVGKVKAHPSFMSFLFTLKNPHNVPPRRFALQAEKKDMAIGCVSNCGPHFYDIRVSDEPNAYPFGTRYTNNTGLDGMTFFTGSYNFQMKEIEVFQITD
jgi:hypothetical protein